MTKTEIIALQVILAFISSGILGLILNLLYDSKIQKQKNDFEIKLMKIKDMSSRQLQVDSYFRNTSSKEMNDLFGKWLDFLDTARQSKKQDNNFFIKMGNDVFRYGSAETISIFAKMQQLNYTDIENVESLDRIVLMATLLSSLKYDFTGYKVNPLEWLRIRITDYTKNEEEFMRIFSKYELNKYLEYSEKEN